MRAAVLHTPGRPPTYGEHPAPGAGAGSTLVRVTAAPVVPLDLLCASGTSYFGGRRRPTCRAARASASSRRRTPYAAGTRVWFSRPAGMGPGDGSLAELCLVPDDDVVPLAADVPDELAAALGLSGVAAWMACPGGRGCSRASGCSRSAAAARSDRPGSVRPARSVLGRVVAVARPTSRRARSRGRRRRRRTPRRRRRRPGRRAHRAPGPFDVVVDPVWGVAATAASRVLAPGRSAGQPRRRAGDEAALHPRCCAAGRPRCSATPTTRSPPSNGRGDHRRARPRGRRPDPGRPTTCPARRGRGGLDAPGRRRGPRPLRARPGLTPGAVPQLIVHRGQMASTTYYSTTLSSRRSRPHLGCNVRLGA